jgi:ABC-type antimicrobial peptide transport system permease subunit
VILRNLLRRPMRTGLTLLGITMATATVLALTAMAEGLLANFASVMAGTGADLTVAAKQEPGAAIQITLSGIDVAYSRELLSEPEVRDVAGSLYTVVALPDIPFFVVLGQEPGSFPIGRFIIVEGQGLSTPLARSEGRPLILGKTAARSLKKGVGDSLIISGTKFRILGVYETGLVMEDGAAVTTLADAQRLANLYDQVNMFLVKLNEPEQAEQVRERLQTRFPELEILHSSSGGTLARWLTLVRPFAWSVAIIAALMGGLGMMNALLMSVIERTREIGVLRAVGWSRQRVMVQILGESLTLTLLGGTAGAALGAALVTWIGQSTAFSGLLSGALNADLLIQVLLMALLMGVIGGAYPAWRATQLAPAEALCANGGTSPSSVVRVAGSTAVRDVFRQRARSALTVLGVGVGVLAVAAVSSLTEGLFSAFGTIFATAELTATQARASYILLSAIDHNVGTQLERIPGVQRASGGMLTLVSLPDLPLFVIVGYEPDSLALSRFRFRSGRPPESARQIALGWKAAQALAKDVGDTVRILGGRLQVVGIYEHGSEHFDSGGLITLRELQKYMDRPRQVQFYEIKLVDAGHLDAVLATLQHEFPELSIARSSEFMEYQSDRRTTRAFTNAILLFSLVGGTVIVMNTMMMSVLERTREIGLFRAVGWTQRQVLGLFVSEALVLTSGAGLLGLAAAWLLLRVFALVPLMSAIGGLAAWPPLVLWRVGLLCVGMGIVGGLYPAWRAARLQPVEALRYE